MTEIHINTRGCKKPLTKKDAQALAALFATAARKLNKEHKRTRRSK